MDNPTFLQYLAVGLAVVFSLALADLWEMTDRQLLGRYLYPGLTSAMALVALGWAWWLERLRRLHAPHTLNWAFALVVIIAWQGTSIWATYNTLVSLLPHQLITPVTLDVTQTQLTYLDPLDEHTPVARLIGYRLPSQDLRPGSAMIADLCWKSTGFTRRSFSYSMQLVGPADIQLGARNSYHGLGSYPITAWRNGESFCDPTSLSVDFAADRPRAYPLVVTLFPIDAPDYRAGPALVSLDASGQEVYPQITRVRVAPLHMPVVTPTISLGGVAGLAGTQLQWLPTHTLSVTLTWLALGATSHNNKVFMHVADSATGAVVAQSDHEPDDGWFPTAYWRKDDVITDQFEIPLPAGADAKGLSLSLGMYDAQTHERLAAVDMATGRRYRDDVVLFAP